MRVFSKTSLPDAIVTMGEIYKLNISMSSAMHLNNTRINTISETLRKEGRKAVLVKVLQKNLKSRTDLHGKPYKPTEWIYTTD